MAHQRAGSNVEGIKEPHSVSLKVLRLSRPSLSIQHPLPTPSSNAVYPAPAASLSYPSDEPENFILSPLLTLPPAFGSAYVGETFSCTLCANNELPFSTEQGGKAITNVRIEAEMKIPSSQTPISLSLINDPSSPTSSKGKLPEIDLGPSHSLQKIVAFDLKEEGSHVLAVTVTYTETTATSGKVRTFRKLYQFVCKSCLVVRTKTANLGLKGVNGEGEVRRWALEAQLENTGEEVIGLEGVVLEGREGVRSLGLNWEGGEMVEKPVLMPGDVQQVAFQVEETGENAAEEVDGKIVFGVLSISWRGSMGNRGVLSTGTLGAKIT